MRGNTEAEVLTFVHDNVGDIVQLRIILETAQKYT